MTEITHIYPFVFKEGDVTLKVENIGGKYYISGNMDLLYAMNLADYSAKEQPNNKKNLLLIRDGFRSIIDACQRFNRRAPSVNARHPR